MISTILLLALVVNGLMLNPGYLWLLGKLKIDHKPFNCVLCLAWWLGIIVGLFTMNYSNAIAVALATSFLAVALNRWFESLPVKFK